MYRFLKARSFDLDKTRTMLSEHVAFARSHRLEEIRTKVSGMTQKDFPHVEDIVAGYPHDIHVGRAKNGAPVSFERSGRAEPTWMMEKVTEDQLKTYILHHLCFNSLLLDKLSEEQDKIVRLYHVIDLTGLGMKHMHQGFLMYIRSMTRLSQDNFPEQVQKIFVINTPWVFSTVFAFVKPFVDVNTQEKMKLLGIDYHSELEQHLDPELVTVKDQVESDWDTATIAAGRSHKIHVPLDLCTGIPKLKVQVQEKNIHLRVWYVHRTRDAEKDQFRSVVNQKVESIQVFERSVGVENTEPIRLEIEFDNSFSRFTGKVVRFRVDV